MVFPPEKPAAYFMKLSDKDFKQFELLWRKFNPDKEIDREVLRATAIKLLGVVSLVYRKDLESREQ